MHKIKQISIIPFFSLYSVAKMSIVIPYYDITGCWFFLMETGFFLNKDFHRWLYAA